MLNVIVNKTAIGGAMCLCMCIWQSSDMPDASTSATVDWRADVLHAVHDVFARDLQAVHADLRTYTLLHLGTGSDVLDALERTISVQVDEFAQSHRRSQDTGCCTFRVFRSENEVLKRSVLAEQNIFAHSYLSSMTIIVELRLTGETF